MTEMPEFRWGSRETGGGVAGQQMAASDGQGPPEYKRHCRDGAHYSSQGIMRPLWAHMTSQSVDSGTHARQFILILISHVVDGGYPQRMAVFER